MAIQLFAVILRYLVDIEIINQNRPAHLEFLEKYYNEGKIVLSGRQNPLTGGVIMIYAGSRDEALNIMHEDPFYKLHLAEINIYEFSPTRLDKFSEFISNNS